MDVSFVTGSDLKTLQAEIHGIKERSVLVFLINQQSLLKKLVEVLKDWVGNIQDTCDAFDFKGKKETFLSFIPQGDFPFKRLVIAALDEEAKLLDFEKVGGLLVDRVLLPQEKHIVIDMNFLTDESRSQFKNKLPSHVALGMRLGAYRFDKYKSGKINEKNNGEAVPEAEEETQKKSKDKICPERVYFHAPDSVTQGAEKIWQNFARLATCMIWARDLVNEPANVLTPEAFAKNVQEMSEQTGLTIKILGQKDMQKLGMNALLAVGQGSIYESKLVVIEWSGTKKDSKSTEKTEKSAPILLVGKGVCFDSGGLSLKPSKGMEEMKGDMGGAACVAGAMRLIALNQVEAHVVGILGLVENMPSSKAQRPGDIVQSMAGITIEVLNTDAEGRMVLADAIHYGKVNFNPSVIIDLATLTGAILVALGSEYAGLFTNNDKLAIDLTQAGEEEGEKLWRLPMGEVYRKMILSKVADIQNIGSKGEAGSITAAEFLKCFVGSTPWAHIDIAGVALNSPQGPTNKSWASGFGVRFLYKFISRIYKENYYCS